MNTQGIYATLAAAGLGLASAAAAAAAAKPVPTPEPEAPALLTRVLDVVLLRGTAITLFIMVGYAMWISLKVTAPHAARAARRKCSWRARTMRVAGDVRVDVRPVLCGLSSPRASTDRGMSERLRAQESPLGRGCCRHGRRASRLGRARMPLTTRPCTLASSTHRRPPRVAGPRDRPAQRLCRRLAPPHPPRYAAAAAAARAHARARLGSLPVAGTRDF
jgi:hypothetical protein